MSKIVGIDLGGVGRFRFEEFLADVHKTDRKEELKQLSMKYKSKEFKVKRYRLTKGFLPEVILVSTRR